MWTQQYDPFSNQVLSIIIASSPVILMFLLLAVFKVKGYLAGSVTLAYTFTVALLWGLPPQFTFFAGLYGFVYGLYPIMYIIFQAFFLYNLVVESGQFLKMRQTLETLTADRRLQVLIIGFCFTAFLDSTAGFVAPVAISTAILKSLGFPAFQAAGLCLIASAVPAAYGAIGIPVLVMAKVTGLPVDQLSRGIAKIIPFMSFLIPGWMVILLVGWRRAVEVLPHILACALPYSFCTWLVATYIGPDLAGVIPAIVSLFTVLLSIKTLTPCDAYRFESDPPVNISGTFKWRDFIGSWYPFILLALMVLLWRIPYVYELLGRYSVVWFIQGLHNLVVKIPPAASQPAPLEAALVFDVLSSVGTAIFVVTAISAKLLGISATTYFSVLRLTLFQLKWPTINMGCVFALAFIINFSGMSATLGLAFASTGPFYPFFTPILALLGSFIVGSNTATNAMFGALEVVSAEALGFDPVLAASILSCGTVAGKMVAPQALAVAASAAELLGKEGEIFVFTIKQALVFAIILGMLAIVASRVFGN
ncbi:L-lactate permease [Sporolituus thermophilus]|uniref:L-lactate permease n=1 Tax=Sporolituus thermophilus DSM 23256 TaxID=1123285 RepID=A0A1G7IRB1_9FIRM|nr:lactate permease LctP family transporter [Sporolituus thermophilus]SDF15201.1 lactate permease [Sporolituus thermophilus DSM 23256]